MKEERKVCELTSKPLRAGFQVHHMDLDVNHYTILDENNFAVLNRQAHEIVHYLFRYYAKDPLIIDRLIVILNRMVELNAKQEVEDACD